MTARHAGYVVTLTTDTREDDAEHVINAIRMIKGVAGVKPVNGDVAISIAEMRRDQQWRDALAALERQGPS